MIKIAIADDHKLFSEGLSSLLGSFETMRVVAQFGNGKLLLDALPELDIDVILMDINMPVLDGIATSKEVISRYPGIRIILLSMHNDYQTVREAIKAGVHGFLIKSVGKEELKLAIETVMNNEEYFTKEITDLLIKRIQSPDVLQAVKLTPREHDILSCICNGSSTQEIADQLFISTNTVETHRKNLLVKTGCKNSAGLVRFAMDNELIQPKK